MTAPNQAPRVLIVEDEFLIALNLQEMLEDIGYTRIDCAPDLRTAERMIEGAPPDLAILDINIGNDLVFPVAAQLRARGVPIVFLSSHASRDLPQEFARFPFVSKPLESDALAAILGSIGFGASAVLHSEQRGSDHD